MATWTRRPSKISAETHATQKNKKQRFYPDLELVCRFFFFFFLPRQIIRKFATECTPKFATVSTSKFSTVCTPKFATVSTSKFATVCAPKLATVGTTKFAAIYAPKFTTVKFGAGSVQAPKFVTVRTAQIRNCTYTPQKRLLSVHPNSRLYAQSKSATVHTTQIRNVAHTRIHHSTYSRFCNCVHTQIHNCMCSRIAFVKN